MLAVDALRLLPDVEEVHPALRGERLRIPGGQSTRDATCPARCHPWAPVGQRRQRPVVLQYLVTDRQGNDEVCGRRFRVRLQPEMLDGLPEAVIDPDRPVWFGRQKQVWGIEDSPPK